MKIEIKISKKPINYVKAMTFLSKRVKEIQEKKKSELIWLLEHQNVYTAGTSSKKQDVLDQNIKIVKTNRGGKITFHGPGQIIFYFAIDLNKRKKDIRWFLRCIEKSIIDTLDAYNIKSKNDKKNIGIWINHKNKEKKVASIGIKISKWIAYHGYALNINIDKKNFNKIIPCGLNNKEIINLTEVKKIKFNKIKEKMIKKFIFYLEN